MIVTVLWEDQRGGPTKGFGPHELLLKCLEDRGLDPIKIRLFGKINSVPKKGVSKLLAALKDDLTKIAGNGPVFAVVDRDKVHEHLPVPRPTNCMAGIKDHVLGEAQAECDLIFLIDNIESLVSAACEALGLSLPSTKPSPHERDSYCAKLVWSPAPGTRKQVLELCPSFARLVERVAQCIAVFLIMSRK